MERVVLMNRASHSIETALLKIFNDCLMAINKGDAAVLVFLDDDHEILLRRLELRFGRTRTALSWFRSYLPNWYQSVSV